MPSNLLFGPERGNALAFEERGIFPYKVGQIANRKNFIPQRGKSNRVR